MTSAAAWMARENPIARYARWLHTRWPAGKPEKLPVVNDDHTTKVPGLFVVGDLSGVPLLKLSANAGTDVAARIAGELGEQQRAGADEQVLDVAIIGGGTAGFAAAKEAEARGLRVCVFEASEPFATIVNFPKAKPIYTYPTELDLSGGLELHEKSGVKEGLIEDLREQTVDQGLRWVRGRVERVSRRGSTFEVDIPAGVSVDDETAVNGLGWLSGAPTVRAKRVIVAIGRSGNYRKLGVPGEDLGKVSNRLHDPADFCGQRVLVVGGGDSALETAIALATCGARVTLSYRKPDFNRPKPENREKLMAIASNPDAIAGIGIDQATDPRQATSAGSWRTPPDVRGSVDLMMGSSVREIGDGEVDVTDATGEVSTIGNDAVFAMIGREAPLDFFRRSGVPIIGERNWFWWVSLSAFLAFMFWIYHWKANAVVPFSRPFNELVPWLDWNPSGFVGWLTNTLGSWSSDPSHLVGTVLASAQGRSFYYTLAYSVLIIVFGLRRIRRRRTPYITVQTSTLMAIQVVPLFLLPEILLPWLGANGVFDSGAGLWIKEQFFPGESWWRAYGLILAWPLMVWNWFTSDPIWGWIVLGSLQTFVLIPGMIYFWGKGAYCGWICSCGAMAETLGDTHRHKMPHGPVWNRLNMIGQVILGVALVLMGLRIAGWAGVGWADRVFNAGLNGGLGVDGSPGYSWVVDLMLAGVLGYGLYFWFSGRVWCRFACPLAALMHIYARFSRFRILAEKSKCISCNVCTSVCHQGIDIMSFANKGEAMADPECVRCSACVQSCPTGVLYFGQVGRDGREVSRDPGWLGASPVRMREARALLTLNGERIARGGVA